MGIHTFALVFVTFTLISQISAQSSWQTDAPFYGQKYVDIPGARGLLLDAAGDILVVSKTAGTITAVYETSNGDENSANVDVCQTVIVNGAPTALNHGISYAGGYLYASSRTEVYRWPYKPGQRRLIGEPAQVVVDNIPSLGHETRTLIFDFQGRLYVSIGASSNIDPNSDRARVRRFTIGPQTQFPIDFANGEVFADGLRNTVGLDFDNQGKLWGVDCGADMLSRPDLGGDIHNDNPAEELNRFDLPVGTHYGYPYCFTAGVLPGYPKGTQFAWPTFMHDGVHTDDWCREVRNNQGPVLSMPAHTAPLGIYFYDGINCLTSVGAFPCNYRGDAFISFHGSWNSDVKVGYAVKRYIFNNASAQPTGESVDVIYESDTTRCSKCLRPVDAIFDGHGHLIVSDDETGQLLRVYYGTPPPQVVQVCTSGAGRRFEFDLVLLFLTFISTVVFLY